MTTKYITFTDLQLDDIFRITGEKDSYKVVKALDNELIVIDQSTAKKESIDRRINFIEVDLIRRIF